MAGPEPSPETPDRPGVVAQPPLLILGALGAGLVLHWLWPWALDGAGLDDVVQFGGGLGLIAAGLVVAAAAVSHLLRAGTNVPVHRPALALVTGGIYRFSRNPIYVGMILAYLGCAVALNNAWLAVSALPLALALHYGVVKREERYLLAKFGAAYRDYLARTRRWL